MMDYSGDIHDGVSYLNANGDNYWEWELQVGASAHLDDAQGVLDGSNPRPIPTDRPQFLPDPPWTEPAKEGDRAHQLKEYTQMFETTRRLNAEKQQQWRESNEEIRAWDKKDGRLRLILYRTCPQGILDAVRSQKSAAGMYAEIQSKFREQGLNEECTLWQSFVNLTSRHCVSTLDFTERFEGLLSRIKELQLTISAKLVVFQFINAVEEQHPDFARDRRHDLRGKADLTVENMIKQLIDETRRDDPVRTHTFTSRILTKRGDEAGTVLSHHAPSRKKNGPPPKRSARVEEEPYEQPSRSSRGISYANETSYTSGTSRPGPPYCYHCERRHWNANERCWYAHPELAP